MTTRKTNRNAKTIDLAWLMAKGRKGEPRIRTLTWGRLARIYDAKATTPAMRSAIRREARRCGYEPRMVLGLNRWN